MDQWLKFSGRDERELGPVPSSASLFFFFSEWDQETPEQQDRTLKSQTLKHISVVKKLADKEGQMFSIYFQMWLLKGIEPKALQHLLLVQRSLRQLSCVHLASFKHHLSWSYSCLSSAFLK